MKCPQIFSADGIWNTVSNGKVLDSKVWDVIVPAVVGCTGDHCDSFPGRDGTELCGPKACLCR
jgi:hypothetical protein